VIAEEHPGRGDRGEGAVTRTSATTLGEGAPRSYAQELHGKPRVVFLRLERRRCFMMEIDELYCDVIVQRWQEFTGEKAEHVAAADEVADAKG